MRPMNERGPEREGHPEPGLMERSSREAPFAPENVARVRPNVKVPDPDLVYQTMWQVTAHLLRTPALVPMIKAVLPLRVVWGTCKTVLGRLYQGAAPAQAVEGLNRHQRRALERAGCCNDDICRAFALWLVDVREGERHEFLLSVARRAVLARLRAGLPLGGAAQAHDRLVGVRHG